MTPVQKETTTTGWHHQNSFPTEQITTKITKHKKNVDNDILWPAASVEKSAIRQRERMGDKSNVRWEITLVKKETTTTRLHQKKVSQRSKELPKLQKTKK